VGDLFADGVPVVAQTIRRATISADSAPTSQKREPTEAEIELVKRAIRDHSSPGGTGKGSIHGGQTAYIVYEPYIGYIAASIVNGLPGAPTSQGGGEATDAMVTAFINWMLRNSANGNELSRASVRSALNAALAASPSAGEVTSEQIEALTLALTPLANIAAGLHGDADDKLIVWHGISPLTLGDCRRAAAALRAASVRPAVPPKSNSEGK
jgi:hypothetical protein